MDQIDWFEKTIGAIATFVEFLCNLEDYASSIWFALVSLAVGLVSSVRIGLSFKFYQFRVSRSSIL